MGLQVVAAAVKAVAEKMQRRAGQALLEILDDPEDGVYWVDPDGEGGNPAFRVYCDLTNGGWALMYANHANQNGPNTWALNPE